MREMHEMMVIRLSYSRLVIQNKCDDQPNRRHFEFVRDSCITFVRLWRRLSATDHNQLAAVIVSIAFRFSPLFTLSYVTLLLHKHQHLPWLL